MSAKRIINPDADDLGQGAVELNEQEFDDFLAILARNGADAKAIDLIKHTGFFAPIERQGFDQLFRLYKMQADIAVMGVCREGSWEAMRDFIILCIRDGSWPAA